MDKNARRRETRLRKNPTIVSLGNHEITPDSVHLKLAVGFLITLDLSTTGYDEYIFRANSLFDPDFTGTGYQPIGFDEWSAFYNRYRVKESRVRAVFSTSGSLPCCVGITFNHASSGAMTFSNNIGEPYTTWNMVGATGSPPVNVERRVSVRDYFGIRSNYPLDEDYTASVSGNPSRVLFAHVWANTTSSAGACTAFVELEFECEFYERVDLNMSLFEKIKGIDVTKIPPQKLLELQKQFPVQK